LEELVRINQTMHVVGKAKQKVEVDIQTDEAKIQTKNVEIQTIGSAEPEDSHMMSIKSNLSNNTSTNEMARNLIEKLKKKEQENVKLLMENKSLKIQLARQGNLFTYFRPQFKTYVCA
jgi:hypothetical protein